MSRARTTRRGRATLLLLAATLLTACGRGPAPDETADGSLEGTVRTFDGVPIAYSARGDGAGALLFIHGWGGSADWWTSQTEVFSHDYRVVTVDLAGHGESGANRGSWTIESLARDVELVIDTLDLGPVVLIGHSLGGPVALETARRLPDRVVGVIGIDAFHPAGPVEQAELDVWLDRLRQDFDGECPPFVETALVEGDSPSTVARVTGGMCGMDPAVAVALLAARRDYDLAVALGSVPVPVRALDGDIRPTDPAALRARHPDFDGRVVEGGGLHPMIERSEETNRLLAQLVEEITSGNTL